MSDQGDDYQRRVEENLAQIAAAHKATEEMDAATRAVEEVAERYRDPIELPPLDG